MLVISVGGWFAAHRKELIFYEIFALAMIVGSLLALLSLLWSFWIEVDDDGLTLRLRGVTSRLPWASVESITVRKVGDSWESPTVDVRLVRGAKLRWWQRLSSKQNGRRIYTLFHLNALSAVPEEVIATLRRHGGDRIDAQGYLQHRAGKRTVARYLAGDGFHVHPHLAEYMTEQRRIETGNGEIPPPYTSRAHLEAPHSAPE